MIPNNNEKNASNKKCCISCGGLDHVNSGSILCCRNSAYQVHIINDNDANSLVRDSSNYDSFT